MKVSKSFLWSFFLLMALAVGVIFFYFRAEISTLENVDDSSNVVDEETTPTKSLLENKTRDKESKSDRKRRSIEEAILGGKVIWELHPANDFQFRKEFFERLEIERSVRDEIKLISNEIYSLLLKQEAESKIAVEENDDLIRYRLELDAIFLSDLKESFLGQLASVAGESVAAIAEPGIDVQFEQLGLTREITLEVTNDLVGTSYEEFINDERFAHLKGKELVWARTSTEAFAEDGSSLGKQVRQTLIEENNPQPVPERFTHLFILENDENQRSE